MCYYGTITGPYNNVKIPLLKINLILVINSKIPTDPPKSKDYPIYGIIQSKIPLKQGVLITER